MSVLYKIKRMTQNSIKAGCIRKLEKLDVNDKSIIVSAIKKYVKNQKFPYTAVDVKLFFESELNKNISLIFIRKIFKRNLIFRSKDFHLNQQI